MDKAKIFKRLKNGKEIQGLYKKLDDKVYTIRLAYKQNIFHLHSFYLEGNDVFEEEN